MKKIAIAIASGLLLLGSVGVASAKKTASVRTCVNTFLCMKGKKFVCVNGKPSCVSDPKKDKKDTKKSSSSSSLSSAKPAAMTSPVTIQNFSFSPAALMVKQGTTVTWKNEDSAPHTVTGDNGGPGSATISHGQSYSRTFDTAGTFPYHCAIHPGMKGTVTVTK